MPKGRGFAPPTCSDGVWFQHKGLPDGGSMERTRATTTGLMLTSPYTRESSWYPPDPPVPYSNKDSKNFKTSNTFSAHDNRHSFQDHGVYFGDGQETRVLGKQLMPAEISHHQTKRDYLKHQGRHVVNYDYNTVYSDNYSSQDDTQPPAHRRFPKIHREGTMGPDDLATSTTPWYKEPEVPFSTPTHVLAVSQEPFLPPSKWKYSNHGRSKCYPPYDKVCSKKPYPIWLVQGVTNSVKLDPIQKVSA